MTWEARLCALSIVLLGCSAATDPPAASTSAAAEAESKPEAGGERGAKLRARGTTAERPLSAIYRKSHAVVIGVDAYQKLDPLRGATRDAHAMAEALRAQGFAVTLVLDQDATAVRLRELLGDELHGALQPDDRVIVYFAGHGISMGDAGEELGYLMPIDGDRERPRSTGLSMAEISSWFERYPAKHVLFLADACYSGLALATRNAGLSPDTSAYLAEVATRPVRFSLVAGTADQLAHEADNQGVFTRFVLEGIAGGADQNRDGLVTTDELASFVKPSVASFVKRRFGASQLPQSARSGTGELVFFTDTTGLTGATMPAGLLAAAPPPARAQAAGVAKAKVPPAPRKVEEPRPLTSLPVIPPKLQIAGNWVGNPSQRVAIQVLPNSTAIMVCRDKSGNFTARSTSWTKDEAVFEGQGVTTLGVRAGTKFKISVRLSRAQDGLSYLPTIRSAGASGASVGQSTTLRRAPHER